MSQQEEINNNINLTSIEKVIIKDTWNKFLAFDSMLIKSFVDRLLLEHPELISQFGMAKNLLDSKFLSLFHQKVLEINPHTNATLRESYRSPPSLSNNQCNDAQEELALFFSLYRFSSNHWKTARHVFLWIVSRIPYLENFEHENLMKKNNSAFYRFFTHHIMEPMIIKYEQHSQILNENVWETMQKRAQDKNLSSFMIHHNVSSELGHYQKKSEIVANQILRISLKLLLKYKSSSEFNLIINETHQIYSEKEKYALCPSVKSELINLSWKCIDENMISNQEEKEGWNLFLNWMKRIILEYHIMRYRTVQNANQFFHNAANELNWDEQKLTQRQFEAENEIIKTGTYTHTFEELEYGSKAAWRNANKCIGRISWNNLVVRDKREIHELSEIFQECQEHLKLASNNRNIIPTISIFPPLRPENRWGTRTWNSQLINFAGYKTEDGNFLGDQANLELTEALQDLGWNPPENKGEYDILPLVLENEEGKVEIFEYHQNDILRVNITHPDNEEFNHLNLQWYAIPAISNFILDIGGVKYGCAPFNGWFMGTEIARDLFESNRYAKAEQIAEAFRFDVSGESTLWKDRAMLELNVAIIHSFAKAGVTLVDHHTASSQFLMHDIREKKQGRECPAQWSWITPSCGGSTTPTWHHEMRDFYLNPLFYPTANRWVVERTKLIEFPDECQTSFKNEGAQVIVLYASETGTAERYAEILARQNRMFHVKIYEMNEIPRKEFLNASFILSVVATCGEGDIPQNGKKLINWMSNSLNSDELANIKFAVLGLGNRIYRNFCSAGKTVDESFSNLGAQRLYHFTKADEFSGQAKIVRQWIHEITNILKNECDNIYHQDFSQVQNSEKNIKIINRNSECCFNSTEELAPQNKSKIVKSHEMFSPTAEPNRSTREIEIEINDLKGNYNLGDHILIYPQNPNNAVEKMLTYLQMDENDWFQIPHSLKSKYSQDYYPLIKFLREDIDLRLPEFPQEILKSLRNLCTNKEEKGKIENWIYKLDVEDNNDNLSPNSTFRNQLKHEYVSLVAFLNAFPKTKLTLDLIVELVPRIQPRRYSIASSPLVTPHTVRSFVSLDTVEDKFNRVRKGLCSHYLSQMKLGDQVKVEIQSAPKHFDFDYDGPVLLIGAGSGLSLLYSILEHREARNISQSTCSLYFGCRNRSEMLAQVRLTSLVLRGYLHDYIVATSREEPREYVQDALVKNQKSIVDMLCSPRIRVVICGSASMGNDVMKCLAQILSENSSSRESTIDGKNYLRKMENEKRLIQDVWGTQKSKELY